MKTGIKLITEERKEQIEKHYIAISDDVEYNHKMQLPKAAAFLVRYEFTENQIYMNKPKGWNKYKWIKICEKTYKERVIIAGALIAAEIDRIQLIP